MNWINNIHHLFGRVRKICGNRLLAFSCASVCPSLRMEKLGSHWTDFHEMWYWSSFENLFEKSKTHWNLTRTTGTLLEDQCTLLIIVRSVLSRPRYVWDKCCRENQNTHFVFNNFFFPKILPFKIQCGNILYIRAGHMRIACWIPKATNTCSEYCFFITTVVARTRLNVTLYVHCLHFLCIVHFSTMLRILQVNNFLKFYWLFF